jgi:hypothetical protein
LSEYRTWEQKCVSRNDLKVPTDSFESRHMSKVTHQIQQ